MRVIALAFALLLVTGFSFGGTSYFGSTPSIAAGDPSGEAPGGDRKDEATNGSGAETNAPDKTTKGEMPGDETRDDDDTAQ